MAGEVMTETKPLVTTQIAPLAIERRIRASAALLIVGLMIEAITLRWAHPTAFLVFMCIGGTCLGAGILLFLYSLVSTEDFHE
jgi:RsiW-degrading membrane proteinase PrsW (M82 family)